MSNVSLGKHSVSIKLVADVAKKGEGAKVIENPASRDSGPRVGITTDVEDYKGGGTSTRASASNVVGQSGASVQVGAGKGVLGALLQQRTASVAPDPATLSSAELKALLAPHFGQPVTVTTYDKDEGSLAAARKGGSVGDTHGVLVNVTDEGVVLKKDGREQTINTEFWALARIRLNQDGARDVIAQDPSYPKLYVD